MNAAGFDKYATDLQVSSPDFDLCASAVCQRMRIGTMPNRLFVCLAATTLMMIAMVAASSTSTAQEDQAAPSTIPSSIETQLDTHIRRYIDWYEATNCQPEPGSTCRGTEYKEARRFCFGDIDGDGEEDISVLYTLESFCCGNSYQFYLAVFLNKGSKFELAASSKVGGKSERTVEFNTIKDGKILLNTDEYVYGDPMCCPSGKGRTAYSLQNGKLIESSGVRARPVSP